MHPPQTQTVVADIHQPPASFADTPASTTTPVAASFPLVELLPPISIRVIEIPRHTPALTAGTVVSLPSATSYPAHCHPPLAPVTQTVPPPAHSHYTYTPVHSYTNVHTGNAPQLLTTAITATTSVSQPHMHYDVGESIVEQVLRGPASTSAVSTLQPDAAESSALPTVASTAKQEPVVVAAAPVSSVSSVAPSAAIVLVLSHLQPPQAPVGFKQLQQPRTRNGSTSWKDYRVHFERVCKVNGWTTAHDKAQNLTLFLKGAAADVLNDVDESVPTAYEDIWTQLGRRFGYTDAPIGTP